MLKDHRYGASASRDVTVYAPAFTSTNLYCFVMEAYRREQPAQGYYSTDSSQGSNQQPLSH